MFSVSTWGLGSLQPKRANQPRERFGTIENLRQPMLDLFAAHPQRGFTALELTKHGGQWTEARVRQMLAMLYHEGLLSKTPGYRNKVLYSPKHA